MLNKKAKFELKSQYEFMANVKWTLHVWKKCKKFLKNEHKFLAARIFFMSHHLRDSWFPQEGVISAQTANICTALCIVKLLISTSSTTNVKPLFLPTLWQRGHRHGVIHTHRTSYFPDSRHINAWMMHAGIAHLNTKSACELLTL